MPDASHSYTPTGRTAVFAVPDYEDQANLKVLFQLFADTAAAIGGDTHSGVHNFTGSLQKGGVDVATLTDTQTLTNKTLTSPTITGGTVNPATLQVGGVAAVSISGAQTLTNKVIQSPREAITVVSSAPTSTINMDAATAATAYYTSANTGNFTLNIRGTSSVSLDTFMSVGDAMTVVLLVTNGSTAYYANTIKIDGTTITPKYQYGNAISAGNASGIDSYVFDIIKTASATFTVFASMTKYA